MNLTRELTVHPQVRPATAAEYKEWLRGYLENGGKITSVFRWSTSSEFVTATEDFRLLARHGARLLHLIVPKGISVTTSELGHSNVYMLDGYKHAGYCVPLFCDINFEEPHLQKILDQARADDRENMRRLHSRTKAHETRERRAVAHKYRHILPKLRAASLEDYKDWLKLYLQSGNPVTAYNGKFPRSFYIVSADLEMVPLHSANALDLIVEKGVSVTGELGHSTLYRFEDETGAQTSSHVVPLFSDIHFDEPHLQMLTSLARAEKASERKQEAQRNAARKDNTCKETVFWRNRIEQAEARELYWTEKAEAARKAMS